ncbi:MAG TPA: ATP-binding protein [bacterium]|nr:ATP-binding protein [bacterium]
MKSVFASLYGRISAIFLVLLLVLSLAQLVVGVRSARTFSHESDQSLNRNLAADLVPRFQPALANGLDRDAIAHHIHDLMVFNPRVEIYVLDAQGRVLAPRPAQAGLRRDHVDTEPIRRFIEPNGKLKLPIYGDDPRSSSERKPFSAAPVRIGGQPGYLYLILGGEQYESIANMLESSYIIRSSIVSLVLASVLIGIVGLAIFFLLTKRLRTMLTAVRAFEHGDYGIRLADTPGDEIGQLARAFNDMAAKVESTVDEMRRSDQLRRELVANVSHDLRSPLASVQGYLETLLIKDAALPASERRRFVEIIHNNVLRLSTLVRELFELSRLEAQQIRPVLEPFALSELVQDVVVKLQPLALERHVALTSALPRDLPFVRGDIGMIERVLTNLIDNALRYTPREGRVEVSLTGEDGQVRVRVSDTGPGIPAEDLPHVFDRFYRVDKSRSRESGGSGIGLAIAKHILDMHGSQVGVERSTPEGTVFTFALPTRSS